jgi:hypothetical protein
VSSVDRSVEQQQQSCWVGGGGGGGGGFFQTDDRRIYYRSVQDRNKNNRAYSAWSTVLGTMDMAFASQESFGRYRATWPVAPDIPIRRYELQAKDEPAFDGMLGTVGRI